MGRIVHMWPFFSQLSKLELLVADTKYDSLLSLNKALLFNKLLIHCETENTAFSWWPDGLAN